MLHQGVRDVSQWPTVGLTVKSQTGQHINQPVPSHILSRRTKKLEGKQTKTITKQYYKNS